MTPDDRNTMSAQTTADAGRTARGWQPDLNWSSLDVGNGVKISTTDQRGRNCGWVFHVSFDGVNGGDTMHQQGGFATEDEAKRAAEAWIEEFCNTMLAALAASKGAK
jgi:hypothetical protein